MNPSTPAREDSDGVRIEEILVGLAWDVDAYASTKEGREIKKLYPSMKVADIYGSALNEARAAIQQLIAEARIEGAQRAFDAFIDSIVPDDELGIKAALISDIKAYKRKYLAELSATPTNLMKGEGE